ncbi:MAG: aminoglycoside phosphotransferase family protein [bacterium]|nr:aminoglycoside phosphotransferase family protein [bacterium]
MKRDFLQHAGRVVGDFDLRGSLVRLEPFHRGHIHDTFVSIWKEAEGETRYLHQRINDHVFQDVPALMHNIERVTRHVAARSGASGFVTLRFVPTRLGKSFLVDESGPWRTYHFIENTQSFDLCDSEDRAYDAARAFGDFQARLMDLDPCELRETIPDFFSSPHRMEQLEDALESDPKGRAAIAAEEVRFALDRKPMVSVIEGRIRAGAFPSRVVHGDTKLNNVLFDEATGKAMCIVDLDTCMPAYSLYDFGDLVRFTAATSSEDEQDLSQVGTNLELYRALVAGYLDTAGSFLTPTEVELMPFAARLVTFTIGLRFLTDYVAGDVYFKTERESHNLDRARVQLAMVRGMEEREREMAVSRVRRG